ncbi:hypothetical protein B0H34DRAFT_399096 [Crassisporium funariophilum]|nr:hypothetical protein B0H34DRAFT_399096 [Crassisporium funariophilum]
MSTGAVVGGIGAGIVAIAAIGFAVAFFIRRSRKRETDGNNFDTQDFRRSAMLLNDPPTHDDTVARGFNPRPPVMAEHRHASPAPTFGTQYGAPGPAYNYDNDYPGGNSENRAGYGSQYPAYGPGQVMYNGVPSPNTASSTQPMFPVALHNQSPFSPIGAPSSPHGHYDEQQQYYENQGLSRQPSMGANLNRQPSAPAGYPVLTRQQSAHSSADAHYRQEHANAALGRESAPVNDYVDLNRSSVSPYQAAQYVEISRRLNTQVPEGLHTPEIDRELPPLPPKPEGISPFADPASAPPSPGGQYAIDRRNLNPSPRPLSGDSIASAASQTLEFPAPPSPAHTAHSRYRVDSTPPTLPEIHLESRVSMGLRNSGALSPLGSGFPSGLGAGAVAIGGTRFPATPSPLASSFGMPSTPGSNRNTFGAVVTAPPPMPASHAAPATQSAHDEVKFEKKRGTMYSVYDDEDAYGGI